jgi:hypothetical protein
MQAFRFLYALSDDRFLTECRALEFVSDIRRAFGRRITGIQTVNDCLIVTTDQDIPDGIDPYFSCEYYGLERI